MIIGLGVVFQVCLYWTVFSSLISISFSVFWSLWTGFLATGVISALAEILLWSSPYFFRGLYLFFWPSWILGDKLSFWSVPSKPQWSLGAKSCPVPRLLFLAQLRLRWVCWFPSLLRWCFQRNVHITTVPWMLYAGELWKDTRNILTLIILGQLACFVRNTPSFLPLSRWSVLRFYDNIPLASLVVSLLHVLDSKLRFNLTPFRCTLLSNVLKDLFNKCRWLAITIFQPESHSSKSLWQ